MRKKGYKLQHDDQIYITECVVKKDNGTSVVTRIKTRTRKGKTALTYKVFCPEWFGGWRRLTGQTCLSARTGYSACLQMETFTVSNQTTTCEDEITQLAHTCNLSHGVEDFQLLWIERRHVVVDIAVERGYNENTLAPGGKSSAKGQGNVFTLRCQSGGSADFPESWCSLWNCRCWERLQFVWLDFLSHDKLGQARRKKQNMNLHGLSHQRWTEHRTERHFIHLIIYCC